MTTVLFEANGEETRLGWTLQFEMPEMRGIIVKAHKADEGQQQNMQRLERSLSGLSGSKGN